MPDLGILNAPSKPKAPLDAQNTTPVKSDRTKNDCQPKPANPFGPNSIIFVRRQIMYGRVEAKRGIPCGLGQMRMYAV